ncbi:MAG TPA: hypothetical protein VLH86_00595 [Patescibacteria group bacterium]|nr:hypothetical protein [Patescibacteria group bacterium]
MAHIEQFPEYCNGCTDPDRRGTPVAGIARGCAGVVKVMRGRMLTQVGSDLPVLHPEQDFRDAEKVCGRLWAAPEPQPDRRVIAHPSVAGGTNVIIAEGDGLDQFDGLSEAETAVIVDDFMSASLPHGGPDLGAIIDNLTGGNAPLGPLETPGGLRVIAGGQDVGRVKAVVGSIIDERFADTLVAAGQAIGEVRDRVAIEVEGTGNAHALGALVVAGEVAEAMQRAADAQIAMDAAALRYLGEIS